LFKIICFNLILNDFYFKVFPNDAIFNFFSILWINSNYLIILPIFLLLLIKKNLNIYLFILMYAFLVELQSYCLNINDFFLYSLNKNNFNFLLKNNLNKIHPFLFYYGVCFFITPMFILKKINHHVNYFNYEFVYKTLNYWKLSGLISSLAMFLGAWWAFQEGSWGGWWNWDSSETLCLISLFFILFVFHEKKKKKFFFFFF